MSHAFAKDSRACAACVSWGGARELAPDNTLVQVTRYSVEGECRTAASQDYRKVTKAYHTCERWAPLPMLKAHGARTNRPVRTPDPAQPAAAPKPAAAAPAAPKPTPKPVETEAADTVCASTPLDIDRVPPPARILHAYWLRLRLQRRMPLAHELDTAQIRECVSRLCLMAPGEGGDFVYRACGRAIQRRLGGRAVARSLAECHPAEAASRLAADLNACLEAGEPRSLLVRGDPLLPGVRFVELLLPLGLDTPDRAALVLAYRHVPGG